MFSHIWLTSMRLAPVEVGQFAIDWYSVGRGDQDNRRISTHNPTNGERIESHS
jgi:hypothetical protein